MTPEEIEILEQARVYVSWEAENSDDSSGRRHAALLLDKIDEIIERHTRGYIL